MDAPVDDFGLPPPAPRKPVEDDPEPEPAPPPPPPPAPEPEHHEEATPAVVTKEGDTLKIVPAAEPPLPAEPEAKSPPAVEPAPVSPPAAAPPAPTPPAAEPPAPKEPEAPIAPVPVPDDHAAAETTTKTTSVEPAPMYFKPEAPVAVEPVASHEATVPKAVPVPPAATSEKTKVTTESKPPAPAVSHEDAHHESTTAASTTHHETATSGTATPAPSTRTAATTRTAASLADLPTPVEVFTGHVAEHPTTLMMRDGQIFDESGEALYRITGGTFTDKDHAPLFRLRRGHIMRTRWKVKPNGLKKKLRIRARQHYGFFSVPMPPESTGGANNREAELHANQLRLGAAKSVFENKAIVGLVEDDKMHVAKGFDLALAGAMWKAQTDTAVKYVRRQEALSRRRNKASAKVNLKSSRSSAATV